MSKSTKEIADSIKDRFEDDHSYRNIGLSERIISVASGAFILYTGITGVFKRRPVRSITEVLAGAGLIYRGATGYCPLKEAIDGKPNEVTVIERRITGPR
ncbi:Protein of unknown function [bacterium A37T11]|nr:Protein of unknown function [bacterium A37T11]